jgi:hypothetical protein
VVSDDSIDNLWRNRDFGLYLSGVFMGDAGVWFCSGAPTRSGQPAGQSFLPQLVSGERFPQAAAWTSSSRQSAVIFGPALGGVIYIWGTPAAYAVCLSFKVWRSHSAMAKMRTRIELCLIR